LSLLVGVIFANFSISLDLPLIAVSHIKGHIAANYLTYKELEPPFVCLMVSGGHTAILNIQDYNKHKLLGSTIDDAAGEAFDKVARILGLSYPGGPNVDKWAKGGKDDIEFIKHSSLPNTLNFSFSGIKTAVINCSLNTPTGGRTIIVFLKFPKGVMTSC
jgi:N6-L-threonylcarbamoyladenine synthase